MVNFASLAQEFNQLKGLAILNLQGIQNSDKQKVNIGLINCPRLQFLNISRLNLADDFSLDSALSSLIELIAHSNQITTLQKFANLPKLRLLDTENNCIADHFLPKNV